MAKYNQPDPRNAETWCWVNGLVRREEAKVSVLDSVVQGGDAVWEGLRVSQGRIFQLTEHLTRLHKSAHALMFVNVPGMDEIQDAVFQTLEANNMTDGVHIRLTLTRGKKSTSGMDPRLNIFGSTLIVLPEYKGAVYGSGEIRLITSSIRRNSPTFLDSKIHHNNLLNNILAKIQANHAGADDALMLDDRGFIAETNATNVFFVQGGELCTPFGHACLPGLTREYALTLAERLGIPAREGDFSLTELYNADEAFTTGTMGGLAHIVEVDGRRIGPADRNGPGPITQMLQAAYPEHIPSVPLPFAVL
ncbi:MAG: aminotransferase class IV [Bacteroidetes bacterium]|nr:aminotransferase class IV [Bacteroidota bacterium]MDA0903772.1 aminotransferase class IV [Bacteroidota bacterium]MDA1242548.1 aminotransferase class IV [Bacteroidota bacterium]